MKRILAFLLISTVFICITFSSALADDKDYATGFTDAVALMTQSILTNVTDTPNAARLEAENRLNQAIEDTQLSTKESFELTFHVSFAVDIPVMISLYKGEIQITDTSLTDELVSAITAYQDYINTCSQSTQLSTANIIALRSMLSYIFDLYDAILQNTTTQQSQASSTSSPAQTSNETKLDDIYNAIPDVPNDAIGQELDNLYDTTLSDGKLSPREYSDWLSVTSSIEGEVTDAMLNTETFQSARELQATLNDLYSILGSLYRTDNIVTQEKLTEIKLIITEIKIRRALIFATSANE